MKRRRRLLLRSGTGIVLAVLGTIHAAVLWQVYGFGSFALALVLTAVAVRCVEIDRSEIHQEIRK